MAELSKMFTTGVAGSAVSVFINHLTAYYIDI